MTDDYLYSNILLLEERGVGAFKYKMVVDSIFHYCEIKLQESYDAYRRTKQPMNWFLVDSNLTKQVDFIDNLTIRIQPHLVEEGEETMGGEINYNPNQTIVGNKLASANIIIDVYIFKTSGKIYERSFYNTIYHELNHAYQLYKVMVKSPGIEVSDAQPLHYEKRKELPQNLLEKFVFDTDIDETRARYFADLFYFVFDKNEYNAMLAGLYGELRDLYKHNDNVNDVIKETTIYKTCQYFLKELDMMVDSLKEEQFITIMFTLHMLGVRTWKTKYKFKKTMRMWLNEMIKKMGRVVSLYIDNFEDKDEIENMIINDPPGSWDFITDIIHNKK